MWEGRPRPEYSGGCQGAYSGRGLPSHGRWWLRIRPEAGLPQNHPRPQHFALPVVNIHRTIHPTKMNTHPRNPPEAWRLQVLKLLQANPSLSQRQLAAEMGVSLGKANYCLRALVEKGLVKLGNFSNSPNKRQYAYLLTPAGVEEKTRITLAFLKRKEAEFKAIQREIEALKGELESTRISVQDDGADSR